jgi:hypothetical protein
MAPLAKGMLLVCSSTLCKLMYSKMHDWGNVCDSCCSS